MSHTPPLHRSMSFSFQGRQGEIKHLFRSFAFLLSRMMTENGGYFVCRARHLALAGGSKQTSSLSIGGFAPMSPRLSSPSHPSSGAGGGAGGGTPGRGRGALSRRDKELIGQTVRIVQGPFKGQILALLIIIQNFFCQILWVYLGM